MRSFGFNSAKSYVGKYVNLHLKDGSVLISVFFKGIQDKRMAEIIGGHRLQLVPLISVNYAESVMFQLQLLQEALDGS